MKLKEFKKTKWYKPTLSRYSAHLKVCRELDCDELIVPFQKFIDEVIDAPSDFVRADMLAVTELELYVAFQRYPAYIEPTKAEQKLDFYSADMGNKMRGGTIPINIQLPRELYKQDGKCVDCQQERGEDGTKVRCRPCANWHSAKMKQRRKMGAR